MATKTDIEVQLFVEGLRLRAERYDIDALNELATIATNLLVTCRKALVVAEDSGADAVEVIMAELDEMEMLPPESD